MRWEFAVIALTMSAIVVAAPVAAPLLGVDHIPVGVNDLDAAQSRFRALGFTIKPGRYHANGIRNGLAKFGDGSFIELITAPAAVDELTTEYRRHLAKGDGPAYLSLYVKSLDGLGSRLAVFGGRDEDGTVTFPDGPLHSFFFGTHQPSPTDRPEHFVHANSALGVDRVWLAPSDPARVERMLTRLGARFRTGTACLAACEPARRARLESGEIVLLGRKSQQVPGRDVIGVSITVANLAQVRAALRQGGVPLNGTVVREDAGRILVTPPLANGMWLEFHEARR